MRELWTVLLHKTPANLCRNLPTCDVYILKESNVLQSEKLKCKAIFGRNLRGKCVCVCVMYPSQGNDQLNHPVSRGADAHQ